MKNKLPIKYGDSLRRALLATAAAATALLTPAASQAWTVTVLNPAAPYLPNAELGDQLSNEPIAHYLAGYGANLTLGNLADFELGTTADAVIVMLPGWGATTYTDPELAVITSLLNSNVRTLVLGDDYQWATSNIQIAALLGGTYDESNTLMGHREETIIASAWDLTEGVSTIDTYSGTVISPGSGAPGYSLTSGGTVSLWGANENFLVVMDADVVLQAGAGGPLADRDDNLRFAQNVAYFLMGTSQVPEPATYAALAGLALLAWAMVGRGTGERTTDNTETRH
ncbi:hypothetical protein OPIT5_17865 [Opitutaceae bacterium TAV5]|nr:hypothetical protein OPIT5_17865 [Opitutaceae bacterium TAV5]